MKAAPRFDAVRKENKGEKLETFIRQCVEDERAAGRDLVCRAVARDANSPLVKALLAAARDSGSCAPRIDILFTGGALDESRACPVALPSLKSACRVSRDPRLRDAHEMLLIGGAAVWMGECMRREPLKCDSYELYSRSCAETAARFRLFFDRLWRASAEPRKTEGGHGKPSQGPVSFAAAVAAGSASRPSAATVH